MKHFWIGFSFNKRNLFSRIVANFTSSKWSHVFLVISKIEDDYLILEASASGGVKFNLLSKYTDSKHHNLQLFEINVDSPKLNSLKNKIGHKYGFAQAIGNAIARVFRLKSNPFTDDEVCSELVLLWLKNTELASYFEHLDPQIASPEDIYRVVTSKQDKFTPIIT